RELPTQAKPKELFVPSSFISLAFVYLVWLETSGRLAGSSRCCARRERPRRRAAEQRDELAALHGCPLLRLRAGHYHTVAEERRCALEKPTLLGAVGTAASCQYVVG